MNSRVLLIAESFNLRGKTWERYDRYIREGRAHRWIEMSLRMGCFRLRDESRTRLESVGLWWDASMNLLPARACGAWDPELALRVASLLEEMLGVGHLQYDKCILVGKRVAQALGYGALEFFQEWPDTIVVPHPSGRNRWWNDADIPAARTAVEKFLGPRPRPT